MNLQHDQIEAKKPCFSVDGPCLVKHPYFHKNLTWCLFKLTMVFFELSHVNFPKSPCEVSEYMR